jgi:hypothetical protein
VKPDAPSPFVVGAHFRLALVVLRRFIGSLAMIGGDMATISRNSAGLGTRRRPPFAGSYVWLALALAVTAIGFWPTTFGPFGPPDLLRDIHGAFAVLWMAMLVVQAWLVERGHRGAHRWIGWSSLVVAPGLAITAFLVVRNSLPSGGLAQFERPLLLTLTWIDLWSLLLFAALYVAAIVHRRRQFLHARFLASTVFIALIPALGRLYGMNVAALHGLDGALHPSFWTCEAVLLFLALRDAKAARWQSPWWLTLVALVAIEWTMFAAPTWAWFVRFCVVLGLPSA